MAQHDKNLWRAVLYQAHQDAKRSDHLGSRARSWFSDSNPDFVAVVSMADVDIQERYDEPAMEDNWIRELESRFREELPEHNRRFVAHWQERVADKECQQGCECEFYLEIDKDERTASKLSKVS